MAATAVLAGGTGLVGSHILTTLLQHPSFSRVYAYSRRPLEQSAALPQEGKSKLEQLVSSDTSTWPGLFPSSASPTETAAPATTSDGTAAAVAAPAHVPTVFLSAIGTTKAAAGSVEAQRAIDLDLNLSLARAAQQAGASVYVLISSGGASSSSMLPYPKMKGELEDAVRGLGFKHVFILRPGLILGPRQESRPAEYVAQRVFGAIGMVSGGLRDRLAQDAEVIGRAAVAAAVSVETEKKGEGVVVLGQADIVRLGRTEWAKHAEAPGGAAAEGHVESK